MAEKMMDECERVCMHRLSGLLPPWAGMLDGGEGQGVFYWRKRRKQLSLKGVKSERCTRRLLCGEECNVTQGMGQLCP